MRRKRNIWESLYESTEGPTVTIQMPREWAETLLHSIAASLEMEGGEDGDFGMGDHEEPDADDMGGPSDFDADNGIEDDGDGFDMGASDDEEGGDGFSAGEDDEMDFAAGEDDDDDEPAPAPKKKPAADKKPSKEKKPKDDDGEDDTDESVRPQTALGESVKRKSHLSVLTSMNFGSSKPKRR